MERTVEITKNSFFQIFTDAITLYELSISEQKKHINTTIAKSSVLSVNYALEAAANSFLRSIELNSRLTANIDRFSTLDKFDFILQSHQKIPLPRGEIETQIIQELIDRRNSFVHPKIKTVDEKIDTVYGNEKVAYHHKSLESENKSTLSKMKNDPDGYSSEDALLAIQALVNFLNRYVVDWWAIDVDTAADLLIPSWTGSIAAGNLMYDKNSLEIILRHNELLKIKFLGLYGILEQFT